MFRLACHAYKHVNIFVSEHSMFNMDIRFLVMWCSSLHPHKLELPISEYISISLGKGDLKIHDTQSTVHESSAYRIGSFYL